MNYFNSRGNSLRKAGELEAAIADYDQAIKLDPTVAVYHLNRGYVWFDKKEYDRAIEDASVAIRLAPKDPEYFVFRANIRNRKGDFSGAFSDAEEAIRVSADSAVAFNSRGFARQQMGDHAAAIEDFSKAISLDRGYGNAYFNRAMSSYRQRDFEKALSDLNATIERNPKLASAYSWRGHIFETRDAIENALTDYKKANELSPSEATAQKIRRISNRFVDGASAPARPILDQPKVTLASSERRVALIIGNSQYKHASPLNNPRNDGVLLANTLRDVGFKQVIVRNDLTREQMFQAFQEFSKLADEADWAVVYYAGHAIEFGGVNYLVPTDAQLRSDRDIELEAVDTGKILSTIEGARRLRVLVLDACRDNPFASQMKRVSATRSLGKGLARLEPEPGTLVVYAAKHGETALDGNGTNSPFAESLVKRINQKPAIEIRRLFDFVRDDVLVSTQRKQQPFSYGSLSASEDFYFVAPPKGG